MDCLLSRLDNPPEWASSWCYFYFFTGCLGVFASFLTLVMIGFTFPTLIKKGTNGLTIIALSAFIWLFQGITSIVMFWICRSSLKSKVKENFACQKRYNR